MALVKDCRFAVRMLVREPGLAAAAVVALAVGVGLTTLLFSIGYGIFLRPLPVPDGHRIVAVTLANVATGRQKLGVSVHDFADWRAAQRSFDDLAAFQYASLNVVVRDGQPERLRGAFLTANGLELLRARPLLGRAIAAADGAPGAPPVLVLGYGAWTTYFGSDPGVVGRAVRADGESATIVGVMPRDFGFPQSEEAWMVLRADPLKVPRGKGPSLIVYGRLRTGASAASAQADLGTIAARLAREIPRHEPQHGAGGPALHRGDERRPGQRGLHAADSRPGFWRSARGMRQRRQPVVRPRCVPYEGGCHPDGPRRRPPASRRAAALRERRACRGRDGCGAPGGARWDRQFNRPSST